jgi:hypothetical protein
VPPLWASLAVLLVEDRGVIVLPPRIVKCPNCQRNLVALSGQLVIHFCPGRTGITWFSNIPRSSQ